MADFHGEMPAKKPKNDELLQSLFRAATMTSRESIQPRVKTGPVPLSASQQQMWFLNRLQPDSPVYNTFRVYYVTGRIDVNVLEACLREIVRRQETLRTIFTAIDKKPVQLVRPQPEFEFSFLDLYRPDGPVAPVVIDNGFVAASSLGPEALKLINGEAVKPFDLMNGSSLRVMLLRLVKEEYCFLLAMPHIVCDGWSLAIFFKELATLYEAFASGRKSPLQPLPIQYTDYALWQREWLQSEAATTHVEYWGRQLHDHPLSLYLPTDYQRPPGRSFRGADESATIPIALTDNLKALSYEEGATLFMTLLAAFQALLYRYSGQTDIVVGAPIANRNHMETQGLIGCFVNSLPLRTDLSGNPSFRELLGRVRQVALDGFAHQDLPFEKLVEELQPERNLSISPLFQVLFVLQNTPIQARQFAGLTFQEINIDNKTAKFDLTLILEECPEGLRGKIEYNSDLFERTTITRIAGHFQTFLEGIVANPDKNISELPLLAAVEQQKMLEEWNATKAAYPGDTCIHELFEVQVERSPDAVAVVFAEQQLTYRELDNHANQLALFLKRRGVGPEVLVGICLERSLEMVVGLLGILKAGGAYVPLDPEYPKDRLSFMAKDGDIQLLLTSSGLLALVPELDVPIICLDAEEEILAERAEAFTAAGGTAENAAYVMYTSGSTGVPKGIEVTHRNVVRLVKNTNYVTLDSRTILLHYAPISFDASTFEIWGALLNGCKLVVCPPGRLALHELGQIIEENRVNTLWLTAALFHTVVENNLAMLRPVRQLLAGGDILSPTAVIKVLRERQDITLINGYGPTENTTFTCCYRMTTPSQAGEKVPIGIPIANSKVYILDSFMQPVPIGVVGELYAGGDGVARGYLNRPELTKEKFIPDPFSNEPGVQLYKTGDLARYRSDSNIEFMGRTDHQVKIRGFRIELGEIEALLSQHPAVSENVVVAQEEESGYKRLVAYAVVSAQNNLTITELCRFLSRTLPEYMLPSDFVICDQLPLTPSGKIDRRALPLPFPGNHDGKKSTAHPASPLEKQIINIWQQILKHEQVNVDDDFFDIGGHSLLAMQLIAWIRRDFQVELPIRDIFEYPTVAGLAWLLDLKQAKRGLE